MSRPIPAFATALDRMRLALASAGWEVQLDSLDLLMPSLAEALGEGASPLTRGPLPRWRPLTRPEWARLAADTKLVAGRLDGDYPDPYGRRFGLVLDFDRWFATVVAEHVHHGRALRGPSASSAAEHGPRMLIPRVPKYSHG